MLLSNELNFPDSITFMPTFSSRLLFFILTDPFSLMFNPSPTALLYSKLVSPLPLTFNSLPVILQSVKFTKPNPIVSIDPTLLFFTSIKFIFFVVKFPSNSLLITDIFPSCIPIISLALIFMSSICLSLYPSIYKPKPLLSISTDSK